MFLQCLLVLSVFLCSGAGGNALPPCIDEKLLSFARITVVNFLPHCIEEFIEMTFVEFFVETIVIEKILDGTVIEATMTKMSCEDTSIEPIVMKTIIEDTFIEPIFNGTVIEEVMIETSCKDTFIETIVMETIIEHTIETIFNDTVIDAIMVKASFEDTFMETIVIKTIFEDTFIETIFNDNTSMQQNPTISDHADKKNMISNHADKRNSWPEQLITCTHGQWQLHLASWQMPDRTVQHTSVTCSNAIVLACISPSPASLRPVLVGARCSHIRVPCDHLRCCAHAGYDSSHLASCLRCWATAQQDTFTHRHAAQRSAALLQDDWEMTAALGLWMVMSVTSATGYHHLQLQAPL